MLKTKEFNRLISILLITTMIITAIPLGAFTSFASTETCRFGGTIAPPIGGFSNFINGNTAGSSGRATLNIDVLDIIAGTTIKANDIYGIEAVTWGANTENRQVYIDVNGVASPMFHGSSSANADRIWAIMSHGNTPNNGGRTEQNTLRYMNIYGGTPKIASNTVPLTPFVVSENPSNFTIRIRPNDNHASLVTAIALLDENGEVLGATSYSSQDSDGTWSRLESFAPECGVCVDCKGIIVNNANSKTFEYENYTVDYEITNSWTENGQNKQTVQISINNTGSKVIENWMLAYNTNGTVEGIWNAAVVQTENLNLDFIRNMGYNANISSGQSAVFGYTLTGFKGIPDSIVMCQDTFDKTEGFGVELNVINDWGHGFIGEIVLTNTTDKPIEWWELTFDTNFTITEIINSWAATLTNNGNCNYTLKGTYTGIIAPNSSVALGFQAVQNGTPRISGTSLTESAVNETTVYKATVASPENVEVYAGFLYSVSGNSVSIRGFDGDYYDPNVVIPAEINGITVTEIGVGAFSGKNITSVTLPDSIAEIRDFAFSKTALTAVTIPGKVEFIGTGAFQSSNIAAVEFATGTAGLRIGMAAFAGCQQLTSITLPNRTKSVGDYAFSESGVTEDSAVIPGWVKVGDNLFYNSDTEFISDVERISVDNDEFLIVDGVLVEYRGTGGEVVIPRGVTAIGDRAFYRCETLTSVVIPNGVMSIGDYTFLGCKKLISLKMPDSIRSIGSGAFSSCENLISPIIIPEGVTSIKDSAFNSCKKLTTIIIPEGVTSIGEMAFWHCHNLKSITIPKSVTSIGNDAFGGFTSLTSVTFESRTPPNLVFDDSFFPTGIFGYTGGGWMGVLIPRRENAIEIYVPNEPLPENKTTLLEYQSKLEEHIFADYDEIIGYNCLTAGHDFGDWIETKQKACYINGDTEDGLNIRICNDCKKTDYEIIKAEHDFYYERQEPEGDVDGWEKNTCIICGYEEIKTIPLSCVNGHSWGDWKITKYATKKYPGSQNLDLGKKIRICSECKTTETFEHYGYKPGDIDGDNDSDIFDVLEILKYLSGGNFPNVIRHCCNQYVDDCKTLNHAAWNAALITERAKNENYPDIFDVLEILKFLVEKESVLDEFWDKRDV